MTIAPRGTSAGKKQVNRRRSWAIRRHSKQRPHAAASAMGFGILFDCATPAMIDRSRSSSSIQAWKLLHSRLADAQRPNFLDACKMRLDKGVTGGGTRESQSKQRQFDPTDSVGARSGDRTHMMLPSRDFKSLASTSFAIRARRHGARSAMQTKIPAGAGISG